MLTTPAGIRARTCAQTGSADQDPANAALKLEASRRECADLKSAYSKMAAELWGAEQLIEQLEDEVATLKARAGATSQSSQLSLSPSPSPSPPPPSSPEASSADSDARPKVPRKPRKPRGVSADPTAVPRMPSERTPMPARFEGVPFFDHFGITDSRELHQKLAAFLIDRDPEINTLDKRRIRTNQSKFKADQFLRLLWLEAPGTPPPYTPGNVDEFFAFFDGHRAHADMGKRRTFHCHDHRVGTWLWPSKITDYASFSAESNKYMARQARGALTGVRAVCGLYEVFKGEDRWHVAERAPVKDPAAATASSKKRKVGAKSSPSGGDGKRKRKARRATTVDADDEESYVSSSGDESPEGEWSCADTDDEAH